MGSKFKLQWSYKYIPVFVVSEPKCVFWNTSANDWSQEGCELVDHNAQYTRCLCTHLTNFAVIMDVNGNLDDQRNVSTFNDFHVYFMHLVIKIL